MSEKARKNEIEKKYVLKLENEWKCCEMCVC